MTQGWPIAARFASENRRRKSVFNPKIAPSSPRLACQRLPWIHVRKGNNPNGGCGRCHARRAETERPQPRCGWGCWRTLTQGSSCLATLGFGTESRWDSDGRAPGAPGRRRGRGGFFWTKVLAGAKSKLGIRKITRSRKIPKGFRHLAQGCEQRATLSNREKCFLPQRGCGEWAGENGRNRVAVGDVGGC